MLAGFRPDYFGEGVTDLAATRALMAEEQRFINLEASYIG